jgi:hypothetical protein
MKNSLLFPHLKKLFLGLILISLADCGIYTLNDESIDYNKLPLTVTVHQINLEYFTSMEQNIEDFNETREQINLGILELLEQHKIELAAQSTEVVVKNYTAVE